MPLGPPASSASVSPQNLLSKKSQGSAGASPVPQSTGRPWRGGKERWGCPEQGRSLGEPSTGREGWQQASLWTLTSRHIHGVEAGQQVTAPLAISLHFAQPVVAVEVVAEVRPLHVGHNHAVQVPAGVQACVVMLYPGPEADTHTISGMTETMPLPYWHPPCFLRAEVQLLWLSLRLQFPHLKNGDSLQGGCAYWWMWIATLPIRKCCLPWKIEDHQGLQKDCLELSLSPWLPKHTLR